MINYSINNFFSKEKCNTILDFCNENGEYFSYSNNDTWDCKRVYDNVFKSEILNTINDLYATDKIKFWFNYSSFDIRNINISLTRYYDGRYLNLHLDKTSNYTTVISLTDDYDDGRFVLSNINHMNITDGEIKIKLNLGEGITFEGNKIYHGVMPVNNGIRCALNIWMNDTDFTYYKLDKTKKLI